MVQLEVFGNNSCVQKIDVSDLVFNKQFNKALVYQVLVLVLAFEKVGLKAQKTRGEVRGGGRKPWKQKGTGRARAGTIRSPLWRGGGMIFASRVIVRRKKINKKMYKLALMCVLSEFVRRKCFFIINEFILEKPSVKSFLVKFEFYIFTKKYLLILPSNNEKNTNIFKSASNITNITVKCVSNFSIVDLLKHDYIVLFKNSIDELYKIVL